MTDPAVNYWVIAGIVPPAHRRSGFYVYTGKGVITPDRDHAVALAAALAACESYAAARTALATTAGLLGERVLSRLSPVESCGLRVLPHDNPDRTRAPFALFLYPLPSRAELDAFTEYSSFSPATTNRCPDDVWYGCGIQFLADEHAYRWPPGITTRQHVLDLEGDVFALVEMRSLL